MKLKTDGRSEEIMVCYFFLSVWIHMKKRAFFERERWKIHNCFVDLSNWESTLCTWTLCCILLLAAFLEDLQKYILWDLRLTDSRYCTWTSQLFKVAWASLIQQPCTAAASQEMCAQTHTFARTYLCFFLFTKGL